MPIPAPLPKDDKARPTVVPTTESVRMPVLSTKGRELRSSVAYETTVSQ